MADSSIGDGGTGGAGPSTSRVSSIGGGGTQQVKAPSTSRVEIEVEVEAISLIFNFTAPSPHYICRFFFLFVFHILFIEHFVKIRRSHMILNDT